MSDFSSRTRRHFLRQISAGIGATIALPELLLADPYRPFATPAIAPPPGPIRLRGRVVAAGRPVAGARITDGRDVFAVDREGRFDFVSTSVQRHLAVIPPRGFELPITPTGTVALHRPIDPTRAEQQHLFELRPRAADDDRHAIVVLADPQTQNAFEMGRFHAETVPDVIATRQALGEQPIVGVACGDIMYDDLTMYPEYERAVLRMGLPFVQVVGNHDLDQSAAITEEATSTFEHHFGPSHLAFDVGAVHYVVLNDVFHHGAGYLGYLTAEQLEWLRKDLAFVERGRTVVVFLHIPVEGSQHIRRGAAAPAPGVAITNRQALYRLLEGYRAHVVAGHTHENEHRQHGTVMEHVTGATCGAWWSGDICHDGTPNGYAVYEVKGEEVTWRYKATGQDASHQIRIHPPGADPAAPNDVVVNVWDWDPAWTVRWFEDGASRGLLSQRRGLDPRSVAEHRGPTLPARREWVEPMITDHLFYGATSPGARSWRAEATDGTGRRYEAVFERGRS